MRRDTEDNSITVMSSSEMIYYTLYFLSLLHHQTACDGFVACACMSEPIMSTHVCVVNLCTAVVVYSERVS